MDDQRSRADEFRRLHVAGDPLVLFNAWDAGSARAVAAGGARAIATGSWSVAAAHGYPDGESLPLDLAIGNLERIVRAVDLPVTIDLESGYGARPASVSESVTRATRAGAVGCNLEDSVAGGDALLLGEQDQAARIRAARAAADRMSIPVFINARTDVFLHADASRHDAVLVDAALQRAAAYSAAGANGLFVPGLSGCGADRQALHGVAAAGERHGAALAPAARGPGAAGCGTGSATAPVRTARRCDFWRRPRARHSRRPCVRRLCVRGGAALDATPSGTGASKSR